MNICFARLWLAVLPMCLILCVNTKGFSQPQEAENPGVPTEQQPTPEIKVFAVQNIEAQDLLQTMHNVFVNSGAKFSVNGRSNSLVVSASRSSLKQIEALVEHLDTQYSKDAIITTVQSIKGHELSQIADVAHQLATPENVKIVADKLTGTLILQGRKAEVQKIQELVAEIVEKAEKGAAGESDVKNLAVKITWLADMESFKFDAKPLRGKLVDVAAELKKQGMLNEAGVLTSVYSTLRSGTKFQKNEFSIASRKGEVNMHVEGSVGANVDSKFDLSISIVLRHGQTEIPLSTSVQVPLNHPIAFAVSDVGEITSAAVVEILEAD